VKRLDSRLFGLLVEFLRAHANKSQIPVIVKVLRPNASGGPSESVQMQLTPRRDWGGRGLLGCHLLPL
jgi:26S proteasome non-ATPase regulatory subunit 9